jgi:hypothetical protein
VLVEVAKVVPSELYSTLYEVIVAPPLSDGAVQLNTDCESAFDVADTPVGAPGAAAAVETAAEFVEYEPVPTAVTAAIRKMYEVALVKPVTVAEVDVEAV